jgi:hypothetical protein
MYEIKTPMKVNKPTAQRIVYFLQLTPSEQHSEKKANRTPYRGCDEVSRRYPVRPCEQNVDEVMHTV